MIGLLEEKRTAIADLCKRYHVRRLDVFGSAAAGPFDPQESDVDFLVGVRALAAGSTRRGVLWAP